MQTNTKVTMSPFYRFFVGWLPLIPMWNVKNSGDASERGFRDNGEPGRPHRFPFANCWSCWLCKFRFEFTPPHPLLGSFAYFIGAFSLRGNISLKLLPAFILPILTFPEFLSKLTLSCEQNQRCWSLKFYSWTGAPPQSCRVMGTPPPHYFLWHSDGKWKR